LIPTITVEVSTTMIKENCQLYNLGIQGLKQYFDSNDTEMNISRYC
jgi:hypothetical protein